MCSGIKVIVISLKHQGFCFGYAEEKEMGEELPCNIRSLALDVKWELYEREVVVKVTCVTETQGILGPQLHFIAQNFCISDLVISHCLK